MRHARAGTLSKWPKATCPANTNVKLQRWVSPWLLAGATVTASVMAQTSSPAPDLLAASLAQAVDAAWERAVSARETRGQEQVALARQAAALAWTPQALSGEVSRRNGRSGSNETELGVVVPIWTLGQRSALDAAANADMEAARAAQRAAHLRVAGDVREAAWAVAALQAELTAAREQRGLFQSLSVDVDRRVRAGDLAWVDALVARAELLSAESTVVELQQRASSSASRWIALTGLTPIADPSEPATPSAPPVHPELALAQLEVERAHAQLESTRRSRRDPAEVALSWKQEREGSTQTSQNSVSVALRIPFGIDARSGPQEAADASTLEVARIQAERLVERQAVDSRTAREALESTQQQLASEETRAALLRERAQLLDKSFRAGETALPDLLRALGAAAQAEGALARQRCALGLARARLHQSLGLTP